MNIDCLKYVKNPFSRKKLAAERKNGVIRGPCTCNWTEAVAGISIYSADEYLELTDLIHMY